jgi:hypothetical protein
MDKSIETAFYEKCKSIHEAIANKSYCGHDSFENYCKKKWGISRRHAYYLSKCFVALDNLQNYFTHCVKKCEQKSVIPGSHEKFLPISYKMLKPLIPLTPKQQIEAWLLVLQNVAFEQITSYDVVWAVFKVTGRLEYSSKSKPNYHNEIAKYKIDHKFIAAIEMEAKSEAKEPELILHQILDRYFNGFFELMKRRNTKRFDTDMGQ